MGLASVSPPGKGDKISTASVKPLETLVDVGMGKVLPHLGGAVVPPSMGQGLGAVTSKEHPSEHWSLLDRHWGLVGWPPPRCPWGQGSLLGRGRHNLNCCCFL